MAVVIPVAAAAEGSTGTGAQFTSVENQAPVSSATAPTSTMRAARTERPVVSRSYTMGA